MRCVWEKTRQWGGPKTHTPKNNNQPHLAQQLVVVDAAVRAGGDGPGVDDLCFEKGGESCGLSEGG
jgi:hypothetical protein